MQTFHGAKLIRTSDSQRFAETSAEDLHRSAALLILRWGGQIERGPPAVADPGANGIALQLPS